MGFPPSLVCHLCTFCEPSLVIISLRLHNQMSSYACSLSAWEIMATSFENSVKGKHNHYCTPRSNVVSSVFVLFVAITAFAGVWDRDVWKVGRPIGGGGGSKFEMVAETGATVQKIRVFRKASTRKQSLRGIRITFLDGVTQNAGVFQGKSKDYNFQQGTRTGRTLFHTSTRGVFDHGQDTAGQANFVMEVGSGMLTGFIGRVGKYIDNLVPVFIKELAKNPTLENVRLEPFTSLSISNLKGTTRKASTTWATEATLSLTAGFSFIAGVPRISSTELSVYCQSELTWATTHLVSANKTSKTHSLNNNCSAQVWKGEINVGWEGILVLDTGVRVYRLPTGAQFASSTHTANPTRFVTITTTSPHSSPYAKAVIQPGTTTECIKFHTVVSEDTCESIAKGAGTTLRQFYGWNKEVTSATECDNLYLGYRVCVGIGA
ncbi:hypothetical protein QBC36DRAFT_344174 [Triangularia setosa]|uniref:LysM domain-containing protein n=1 Tax=Triangularia setosa TaxID=2587417 RepID=A0AAN6WBG4_9PEZI|nr:hypothetical protein QBC36DRAFT_344174 [Podospora setosa]